jgi:hypothetical protein
MCVGMAGYDKGCYMRRSVTSVCTIPFADQCASWLFNYTDHDNLCTNFHPRNLVEAASWREYTQCRGISFPPSFCELSCTDPCLFPQHGETSTRARWRFPGVECVYKADVLHPSRTKITCSNSPYIIPLCSSRHIAYTYLYLLPTFVSVNYTNTTKQSQLNNRTQRLSKIER